VTVKRFRPGSSKVAGQRTSGQTIQFTAVRVGSRKTSAKIEPKSAVHDSQL
jgi:hypothetical protein